MSDRVNWIPVAVVTSWSASVVFQAWSAINEWRKKSRYLAMVEEEAHHQSVLDNERRIVEYGRITKRGEKFNGWKSCKVPPGFGWKLIPPMWPKNGEDAPVDTSVLAFGFKWDSNANSMYYLRRYSLIAPGLYDDIVQIVVVNGSRNMECYGYIDENVVAIRQVDTEMRILLVDVNSKTYQFIETTRPPIMQYPMICTIFRHSIDGNLMVLYRVWNDNGITHTFHLVEYELSPSDSVRSPIVRQVESRKFDWPHGNWSFTSLFGSGLRFPGAFFLMRNLDDSRVISLDRHGFHDYGRQSDWIAKFERTRLGLRMAKSKDPLEHVVPGGGENGSAVRYEMHRSQLFARVVVSSTTHLVHRPISVPSLKYLAAEAYCLANQNLNLADIDWTKSIGFDISDGILEAEKKPAVIGSLEALE